MSWGYSLRTNFTSITWCQGGTVVTLYEECQSKSKTSNVQPYTELQQQKYFDTLNPPRARVYFQIRAGVYDVKANRKYWYSDEVCRLCEQAVETIEHVLNDCTKVCRSDVIIEDVYDQSPENVRTILSRVEHFERSVAERGTGSPKSTRKSWRTFYGYLIEVRDLWHTNYKNQRPYLMLLHSAMWLFILFCSNSDVQELNYSESPRLSGGKFFLYFPPGEEPCLIISFIF